MTNRTRFDHLPRREGDTPEQHAARIRFLERISDRTDPNCIRVVREGTAHHYSCPEGTPNPATIVGRITVKPRYRRALPSNRALR